MTDTFIPASDFLGDDEHRPKAGKPLGRGSAVYNGQIVFANMIRTDAEALLPPHLRLAQNKGAHPDVHPVIHLHGEQTQGAWVINGQAYPVGVHYGEFMLLIPFVQVGSSSQWYNFVVRMYLDDWGATMLGKYFGYRKELAFIHVTPSTFKVDQPYPFNPFLWRPVFQADHSTNLEPQASQLAYWPAMQAILAMPILGVDEQIGTTLASYFLLDFAAATVRPIRCQDSYKPAFDPTLAMASMVNVKDAAVSVEGAGWQIEYPAVLL